MNITFADKTVNVRSKVVEPGRIRCGDFVMVAGQTLKCETVQHGCPCWESNTRTFSAFLFVTEQGVKVPVRGLTGKITVMRKSR